MRPYCHQLAKALWGMLVRAEIVDRIETFLQSVTPAFLITGYRKRSYRAVQIRKGRNDGGLMIRINGISHDKTV